MFNQMSLTALGYDFETTGLDVEKLGVCQSALAILTLHQDGSYEVHEKDVQLLNPGVPIEPGAAAIHGYDDFAVMDKPDWIPYLEEQFAAVHDEYRVQLLIGYNIMSFDNRIGARAGLRPTPSLDLMKGTRKLKKEQGWEKGTLVYVYEKLLGKPLEKAHDAYADVAACLELIQPMMQLAECANVTDFYTWLKGDDGTPEMKINFGKDKGLKLKRLDKSYVKWLLSDECQMKLSHELEQGLRACL